MDIFISCLTIWIAPASLFWVVLTSKWLNARVFAVGRLAEGIAWVSVASASVAAVLWALFVKSPVETTITSANWIGIRFDALSAIILLLVCFMGAIILRYSKNYLAGDENQGHFFKWMCVTLGAVIAMVLAPGLVQFALAWVATSLGLHKDDKLPFDVNNTSPKAVIADIIMQPLDTELLKQAKNLGRSVHYGKYMIESQIDLAGNFLDLW